jgi:hypothetical protein
MCQLAEMGKEVMSVIFVHNVPHSVPCIELLYQCQKFFDDPILSSPPYVVQSNVSPDAFTPLSLYAFMHFMEIHGGLERHFCPEILDDVMLVA